MSQPARGVWMRKRKKRSNSKKVTAVLTFWFVLCQDKMNGI